jgi:1,4-dihydroxy-2-naphthoate octaprenyltransferase
MLKNNQENNLDFLSNFGQKGLLKINEGSIRRVSLLDYFLSIRPQFIFTSFVCWLIGVGYAFYKGTDNYFNAILALIAALFFHATVNAFNELFDYLRGNDTPEYSTDYSGGGGYLVKGIISPFEMANISIVLLIISLLISVYFVINYPIVIIPGIIGLAMILLYTPFLKPKGFGEIAVILGFASITLGSYIVSFDNNIVNNYLTLDVVFILLVAGFWESSVLLINEFPDYENDKKVNTLNWVVRFGRKNAAIIFLIENIIIYLSIALAIIFKYFPVYSLLSFLGLFISINNFIKSYNYKNLINHMKPMEYQVKLGYFLSFSLVFSFLLDKFIK